MRKIYITTAIAAVLLAPFAATAHGNGNGQFGGLLGGMMSAKPKPRAEAPQPSAEEASRALRKAGIGPTDQEIDAFLANKPEVLKPYYRTLYVGGERNSVLNFQRLGLAAIDNAMWKDAEWAFDHALDRIEAIFGDNAQAAAARSAFHNEANKDYKGEPYERSMAYYYRGLLYLRAGDYDNARATFKSAEYQDTLSDAETFQSDFAVMDYLVGWTQRCQGQTSSAQESFKIAAAAQPGLTEPPVGDNVLFVAEMGNGPVKARDGAQAQKLLFQAGPSSFENAAAFQFASGKSNKLVQTTQASSVYYQATTRGGRPIDGILNGKASLKTGTSVAGDVLMNSGDSTMMMVGFAAKLFSSSVKTKADIRQWDGLPDAITVGTAKATDANWTATPMFMANGSVMPANGPMMRGDGKACSVVWARSRHLALPADIVGEDYGVQAAVSRKPAVQQKDKAFRVSIEG